MRSTPSWSSHVPLYEYECDACGGRFEVIQKFSDTSVDVCKKCGKGPVHRLLSSPAIQFKGSGWYITDYAKKGTTDPATSSGKSDQPKSDSGAETTSKSDAPKADAPKGDTSRSDAAKSDTSKGESAAAASKSRESGASASKSKE
jgi:putative FmdB family regulatory protein